MARSLSLPPLSAAAAAVALWASLAAAQAPPSRDNFDCKMRNFAVEFANTLQPWRPAAAFSQLADALNGSPEKAPACNVIAPAEYGVPDGSRFRGADLPAEGNTFFVAPTGSDAAAGTVDAPFATVAKAVAATRGTPGFDTIILRAGEYFQPSQLQLNAGDKGLTIQAYPGEDAWLSGAKALTNITWTPYNVTSAPSWEVNQNTNAVYGDISPPNVLYNGTYPSWAGCDTACKANWESTGGAGCKAWTWHDAAQSGYELHCYFRVDTKYQLVPEAGHMSGRLAPAMNIWAASLAGKGIGSVPGLRLNGGRMIRARFPNAEPETQGFMPPYVFRAGWTPQMAPRKADVQIDLPYSALSRNTTVSMFQVFTAGA